MRHAYRFLFVPLALGAALSAQALTFGDDFSVAQDGVVHTNGEQNTVFGSPYAFAPGITRTLGVTGLKNDNPGFARGATSINGGQFSFSSDFDFEGTGFVRYQFDQAQDFTGMDSFRIDLVGNDRPVDVTIYGDSLDGAYPSQRSVTVPTNTGATSVLIENAFANTNFSKIRVVWLFVSPTGFDRQGLDVAITGVQAVPEPATMAVLGIGALGVLRRRRKA